jgi:Carboxypeptidase regulatory-like domain
MGPSELMCTHYHNVIDFGQVTIPSLHGTIRVQLQGRDNQPVSDVVIYLKKHEPHRDSVVTVTTTTDGTFRSDLAPGNYHMETCHLGYSALRGDLIVQANAPDRALDLLTTTEDTPKAKKQKDFGVQVIDKD